MNPVNTLREQNLKKTAKAIKRKFEIPIKSINRQTVNSTYGKQNS